MSPGKMLSATSGMTISEQSRKLAVQLIRHQSQG